MKTKKSTPKSNSPHDGRTWAMKKMGLKKDMMSRMGYVEREQALKERIAKATK